jgi:predicted RNA-binding Zn-ribbon protein involved in translation (DUF1610 family)
MTSALAKRIASRFLVSAKVAARYKEAKQTCPQCGSMMRYDDGRDAYVCKVCGYVGVNGPAHLDSIPYPPTFLSPEKTAGLGKGLRTVDINDLPETVQEDIIENLLDEVPRLGSEDADTVRDNLIGLVESVPVLVGNADPKILHKKFYMSRLGPNRGVSRLAVDKLKAKLDHGIELDPVLVAGDRWIDGGHRVVAYVEAGRKTIPVVDIKGLLDLDWDAWLEGTGAIRTAAFGAHEPLSIEQKTEGSSLVRNRPPLEVVPVKLGDKPGTLFTVKHLDARCEQPLSAYRVDDKVFIQPTEMNPTIVPRCNSFYTVSFYVNSPVQEILYRGDHYAGESHFEPIWTLAVPHTATGYCARR